jgi:hypothetical protein
MLLALSAAIFVVLIALSMPIVFALGLAGVAGLIIGGYPLQMLPSSLVAGSQNWVLLAIPSFVFAGTLMERCGMSHALVNLARALVGWLRGGLGMSVIVVSYFFSDICGSKMAEVSALGSTLMPSLRRAGYRPEDGASGGEEFAVVIADACRDNVFLVGERIRLAFAAATTVIDGHQVNATASVGVAIIQDPEQDVVTLLAQADQALYRAKHFGRNRVVVTGLGLALDDVAVTEMDGGARAAA